MIEAELEKITAGDCMDSRFNNTLGKRTRLLRMDLNLKQGELAERIGIRHSYMSGIENDKANPTGEVLAKLADALGTSTDYLLLLTDDATRSQDNAAPTFLSEEAEQAAAMIDEMYPDLRRQAVAAVRGIYSHYEEHARRDRLIMDLLNSIEALNGPKFRHDIERKLGLPATLSADNGDPSSL